MRVHPTSRRPWSTRRIRPEAIASVLVPLFAVSAICAVEAQLLVVSITTELIEEALQIAADDKAARKFLDAYVVQTRAGWGDGPQIGSISTPFSRVVQAGLLARKNGKPLSASDVPAELLAPELHVIATSQKAALGTTDIATVQSVVLVPRGNQNSTEAIPPLRTAELTTRYQDLHGTTIEGSAVVAIFPSSAIAEDFEIRIVFERMASGSTALSMCKECTVLFNANRIR
jgi:hypothetical protein